MKIIKVLKAKVLKIKFFFLKKWEFWKLNFFCIKSWRKLIIIIIIIIKRHGLGIITCTGTIALQTHFYITIMAYPHHYPIFRCTYLSYSHHEPIFFYCMCLSYPHHKPIFQNYNIDFTFSPSSTPPPPRMHKNRKT